MRRQQWGLYAIALAVLIVGLVWAGVPASTLLFAGLVLVCPLMMLFMHGSGGHAGHGHNQPTQQNHDVHSENNHDENHRQRQELRR